MTNRFPKIAVTFALIVLAQTASADDFDRLARAVAATEGHRAEFRQIFIPHGSNSQMTESGSVTFGELPEMRWIYERPEKKTFVFDGSTSWLYVAADRQVAIHRLRDSELAELPFLLLKDGEAARANFTISSSRQGDLEVIQLSPRRRGQIRSLSVSIDMRTSRISTLAYDDREGNRTRFEFEGYAPAKASSALFRFEPPPGVEIVEY